jgi:glutamate/tyrosine decarboxylase-like PLP-dependent enzyme
LVFRYIPTNPATDAEAINAALPRRLFDRGEAVLGHTVVDGRSHLKFTLINPCTEISDIERLIALIATAGRAEEAAIRSQMHVGAPSLSAA